MLWATINNAHNGFLTLWLDLGFAGIGAFLLTVLVGLRRLIGRIPHERGLVFGSAWLPALFTYCLLYMIPVTTMAGNNIVWTLYVATIFYWTGPPAAIKAVGRQVGKVAIMNRFEDRKVGARP